MLHFKQYMEKLLSALETLKKTEIKTIIDDRLKEFSKIKDSNSEDIFKELCFCIMTANCGAEKCIEVHEKVDNNFLTACQSEIAELFKEYGYRFPNLRSKYIAEAQEKKFELFEKIQEKNNYEELRSWIVKNIKGIGYKEASHFLRNIGFTNYAIVDFHIVDLLVKYKLIEKPKTMSKSNYLRMEEILKQIGEKANLNMAELDLYLWYTETGKILK
ncbi:MAG: N-glycosylase/DNA lyase [Candidatus Hermodarchaeota archaeon]